MIPILSNLTIDYPVIITLIGITIIGISSGVLSCYAVLREQSLLGDAISHAVLPGLCITFLITLTKQSTLLLLGGLISGLIGTIFITLIINNTILKTDAALGIILSIFFGFWIFLLTIIQKIPTSRQSGLETFLFGNAASILQQDLYLMGTCLIFILLITTLFWKEFKCTTFDRAYYQTLGFPVTIIETILTILLVITIVIGLQSIGVILMSALVIAPGVAARQWTHSLNKMMIISILISCSGGITGVLISSSIPKCPTGPVIVICISILVIISILFSPKRGIIINWINQLYNRKNLQKNTILTQFYTLAQSYKDLTHPHDIKALSIIGGKPTLASLLHLQKEGLVYQKKSSIWGLTQKGIKHAKNIIKGTTL